jgi:competence protein ComEC
MPLGIYVGNVGQGQCVTIVTGSGVTTQAVIVDLGGSGSRLATWLKRIGVRSIASIILSHNHNDHIAGLAAVVEAFAGKVGKVYYVIDQPPNDIPFWTPIQEWLRDKKIRVAAKVCPEDTADPTSGRALLPGAFGGYQLYCVYPTEIELAAVAQGADILGTSSEPGNPNSASAVLRLARTSAPDKSIALLGGDLTFRGWKRLTERGCDLRAEIVVVPHHGSAKGTAADFGPGELAKASSPSHALFSVGTTNTYNHPAPEMVKVFRRVSSIVQCTQITPHCHPDPPAIPNRAVLQPDPAEPRLASSGIACAGSIVVHVPDNGAATVMRVTEHQAAVDKLPRRPVCPLCRA